MKFKLWFENQWQKFQRQRLLPYMHEPERPFGRHATTFLGKDTEDFDLKDSQYEPGLLYHVTTNLKGVKIDSRLKSRAELGGQGIGLGGGPSNMAPNMVSLTYNYGKALEIYEGLKIVADIVSNRISASTIYDYVISHHDSRFDTENKISNTDRALIYFGVPKKIILDGDEEKIKIVLNTKIVNAEQKYELLQDLEKAVLEDNPSNDNSDYIQFDPVVGFTAPFESIKGLNANNIAIIQVAIRKDAEVNHYVQEAEIRVNPKDLVILRYFRPK
jgi:hypothetical protein